MASPEYGSTSGAGEGVNDKGLMRAPERALLPQNEFAALFDLDAVAEGLIVRNFVEGDRMKPRGVGGTRKLKDIFIDHKLPRPLRAAFPVVTLSNRAVWLPGICRSEEALVTERTRRVLRLRARRAAG